MTRHQACKALKGHQRPLSWPPTACLPAGRRPPSPEFDRITFDPKRCLGKVCIRNLRMPVASILNHLASGMSVD